MPTQKINEHPRGDMFVSCDLLSLLNDEMIDYAKQRRPHGLESRTDGCSPITVENDILRSETLDDSVSDDPVDLVNTEREIDCLSDKFDSIGLNQDMQKDMIRFDEFESHASNTRVDVYNAWVQCGGPCIDVQKVYRQDDDGDTLLHIALIILSPEIAFYFIDMTPHFSWLNIQNKLSQTPLHLAVLTNQVSLVRRLVVAGADLQSRDRDGNMAIHVACRENFIHIVRALLEPVRYEEQKRNNYDIPFQNISLMLEAKNYEGFTCLQIAGLRDNLEIVKTLIDNGADVNNAAEKSGRTLLHEAAWIGNLNLVKYLISLDKRCNINAKTYDGYTAFDLARSRGRWSIVVELATAGANSEDVEIQ